MKLKYNDLTADIFPDLYTSVGWEPPRREQVETALCGSVATLTAVKAVPFCRKMGFEERSCAWDGPGMVKMLR